MAGRGAKKKAEKRRKRRARTTPAFSLILKLGTIEEGVGSFEELIKMYAAGKMREKKFRCLCYSFSIYVQYLRLKSEKDFEDRLKEIEDRLGIERSA